MNAQNEENEKKLKQIAAYLKRAGITSNDEADLLEEYEDTLTLKEIGTVCKYLAAMEREEASSNANKSLKE